VWDEDVAAEPADLSRRGARKRPAAESEGHVPARRAAVSAPGTPAGTGSRTRQSANLNQLVAGSLASRRPISMAAWRSDVNAGCDSPFDFFLGVHLRQPFVRGTTRSETRTPIIGHQIGSKCPVLHAE
jgi:hypothetical protein